MRACTCRRCPLAQLLHMCCTACGILRSCKAQPDARCHVSHGREQDAETPFKEGRVFGSSGSAALLPLSWAPPPLPVGGCCQLLNAEIWVDQAPHGRHLYWYLEASVCGVPFMQPGMRKT